MIFTAILQLIAKNDQNLFMQLGDRACRYFLRGNSVQTSRNQFLVPHAISPHPGHSFASRG